MLKLTKPFTRESAAIDPQTGKLWVVTMAPPLLHIGFRTRHSRQTHVISVQDAAQAARQSGELAKRKAKYPVLVKDRAPGTKPKVVEEIVSILRDKGKLNIAQVLQQLNRKSIRIDRARTGEFLELLKRVHEVEQDGFSYKLVKR